MKGWHFLTIGCNATIDLPRLGHFLSDVQPKQELCRLDGRECLRLHVAEGEILIDGDERPNLFTMDVFVFENGIAVAVVEYASPTNRLLKTRSRELLQGRGARLIVPDEDSSMSDLAYTFLDRVSSRLVSIMSEHPFTALGEREARRDAILARMREETGIDMPTFAGSSRLIFAPYYNTHLLREVTRAPGSAWRSLPAARGHLWTRGDEYAVKGNPSTILEDLVLGYSRVGLLTLRKDTLANFIETVQDRAGVVRANLKETNRVFWEKQRDEAERYSLDFLECQAKVISDLDTIEWKFSGSVTSELTDLPDLTQRVLRNLRALDVALRTLLRPIDARDQRLLQRETEKVSDRLVLLTILAAAGALIAVLLPKDADPEIRWGIAAFAVLLVPGLILADRLRRAREHRRSDRRYLESVRTGFETNLEGTRKSITTVRESTKFSNRRKVALLSDLRAQEASLRSSLESVDGELERLG